MKRPLFAASVFLVCIIAIYYMLSPPSLPAVAGAEWGNILLYGQVVQKERRVSYAAEQNILYLSDVSMASCEDLQESPNLNFEIVSDYFQNEINCIQSDIKNQVMCYTVSAECEPCVGSYVLLKGRPQNFERARNEGEFDSRLYYATLGICFSLKDAEVLWESDTYSVWREWLWDMKSLACEKLERLLGESAASVMKTMLLGERQSLDREIKELYQANGIAHILAISGLHISFLGTGLYKLLRKAGLPILLCAFVCGLGIVLYGVMTGAGVSAYRAVGMFLIRMSAEVFGRSYDMPTALGILLASMVCQQPLYLFHTGFLLSFTSLLGIGFLLPALEEGRRQRRAYREGISLAVHTVWEGVRQSFWSAGAVVLATMPVTFWYFYELPLYGVLLNLAVIPLMTVLICSGVILLLLPGGMAWVAWLPACLIEGILWFYCFLCELSEKLPGHTWIRGRPRAWQMAVYVFLLLLIVWGRRKMFRLLRLAVLVAAVAVLGIKIPAGTEISFLDVGQGDSVLIQSAGSAYLVDVGSSSEGDVGKYSVAPCLKYRGVARLEAVIITHPDEDHCNGLVSLLEEGYAGRVGWLLLPEVAPENRNEAYRDLERVAADYQIRVGYLAAGMNWEDGEVSFLCLNPVIEGALSDPNEYSVVLYVQTPHISALLTGDAEGKGEEAVLGELRRYGIGDVTVLKVAHHGSKYATSREFLEVVNPRIAIISCGRRNSYGHPHEEVLMRLEETGAVTLSTPQCGQITVSEEDVWIYGKE